MTEITSPPAAPPAEDPPSGDTRAGFIAIVGAPNAGKSTLLNTLVGAKIAIVTPKAQTTRSRLLGIALEGRSQLLFVDTPGIFQPKRRLDRAMVAAAWSGAEEADRILLMVDASARTPLEDVADILDRLRKNERRILLALNKVDDIRREKLLELAAAFDATGLFEEIFMISAKTGDGVDRLRQRLAALVPAGPWLYEEDQISDMPMRLLAAEITREKAFLQLHDEIPYQLTVETESWETFKDGSAKIAQVIYVERDSQKGIVLGKGGAKIKSIGTAARQDIEALLEHRVHLSLFVKVREAWGDDPERYRDWNLDPNA